MKSILKQIRRGDKVNIIEFSSAVKVWNIFSRRRTFIDRYINYNEPFGKLSVRVDIFLKAKITFIFQRHNVPRPIQVNGYVLKKALQVINALRAYGATNIIGALETALYIVKKDQESYGKKHQPIIVFLTDGEPNVGIGSTEQIVEIVCVNKRKSSKRFYRIIYFR